MNEKPERMKTLLRNMFSLTEDAFRRVFTG